MLKFIMLNGVTAKDTALLRFIGPFIDLDPS